MNEQFRSIGATTFLAPIPAVILCCADAENGIKPNLITVAWTGVINSKPPMISVSIRKDRYSHDIIASTGKFTLNFVNRALCRVMDYCGVKSGRDTDKFSDCSITMYQNKPDFSAPAIKESPVYLCCEVDNILELPSHDTFICKVVDVHVAERYFREDGSIDEAAMELVAFVHGHYYALEKNTLGFFGYSVASQEALNRRK